MTVPRFDTVLCGSTESGHPYWHCQLCQAARADFWERRKTMSRWQRKAHAIVNFAKASGILPQLDGSIACTDCGTAACEYDHRDYGHPLDVQPVCHSCNIRRGPAKCPSPSDYSFALIAPSKSKRVA